MPGPTSVWLPLRFPHAPSHFTGFGDTVPLKQRTLEGTWKQIPSNLQKKEEDTADLKIHPSSHLSEKQAGGHRETRMPKGGGQRSCWGPAYSLSPDPLSPRRQFKPLVGRDWETSLDPGLLWKTLQCCGNTTLVCAWVCVGVCVRECLCTWGYAFSRGHSWGDGGCTWGLV